MTCESGSVQLGRAAQEQYSDVYGTDRIPSVRHTEPTSQGSTGIILKTCTYIFMFSITFEVWLEKEIFFFKHKILAKLFFFFNHTTQSFREHLSQLRNSLSCQFSCTESPARPVPSRSEHPPSMELLGPCPLMFPSRTLSQFSFLAHLQLACGDPSRTDLAGILPVMVQPDLVSPLR